MTYHILKIGNGVATMNSVYYQMMSKKSYLALVLTIVGFISLFFDRLAIALIALIFVLILSDGLYTSDLFIEKNKKMYFMKNNLFGTYLYSVFTLIILFIGFLMIILQNYYIFMFLYYLIVIGLFINNLIISRINKNVALKIEDSNDFSKYNIVQIKDIECFKDNAVRLKINDEKYLIYINKSFIDYKNLLKKLKIL